MSDCEKKMSKKQANLLMVLDRIQELEKGYNKAIQMPVRIVSYKRNSKDFYSVEGHNHKRAPHNRAGRKEVEVKPKAIQLRQHSYGISIEDDEEFEQKPYNSFYGQASLDYLMGEKSLEEALKSDEDFRALAETSDIEYGKVFAGCEDDVGEAEVELAYEDDKPPPYTP